MKEYLTYDDVQILPKYSEVKHRADCNTSTSVTKNYKLDIPIVSSPMDTVTEYDMAYQMSKLGGMGIIHRFLSIEEQSKMVDELNTHMVGAAIGVTGDFIERAQELVKVGVPILCMDVAHGHHKLIKEPIRRIKMKLMDRLTSWWETFPLERVQEIFVNGGLMALGLASAVVASVVLVFKLVWEYLWLVPFGIALLLQMVMMSLVWLMVGLGAAVMYVKDLVPVQKQ